MKYYDKEYNLEQHQSKVTRTDTKYNHNTPHSDFPKQLDDLKKIEFSGTSMDNIKEDLNRYHELLVDYLEGAADFDDNKDEFNSLGVKLEKYNLNSKDFIILRDSLIESIEYIKEMEEAVIFGENGAKAHLRKSLEDFEKSLGDIINEINSNYEALEDGSNGKLLPTSSIGKKHLTQELIDTIEFLEKNFSIYVDRTKGELVSPNKNSIVIKVVE